MQAALSASTAVELLRSVKKSKWLPDFDVRLAQSFCSSNHLSMPLKTVAIDQVKQQIQILHGFIETLTESE